MKNNKKLSQHRSSQHLWMLLYSTSCLSDSWDSRQTGDIFQSSSFQPVSTTNPQVKSTTKKMYEKKLIIDILIFGRSPQVNAHDTTIPEQRYINCETDLSTYNEQQAEAMCSLCFQKSPHSQILWFDMAGYWIQPCIAPPKNSTLLGTDECC